MIKQVYKLLQKENLITIGLTEIKTRIINPNDCDRSVRGLCKCEAYYYYIRARMQRFGEFQGSKYAQCPAYLYVIRVCHTYWSKTIFSHSSLISYKFSVLFQKLEIRPTFLELACLVTDYFIPAKKSRSHLPISMRHTEDQYAVSRCHSGICPQRSQLLPVRSMPEKLHMEQEV